MSEDKKQGSAAKQIESDHTKGTIIKANIKRRKEASRLGMAAASGAGK